MLITNSKLSLKMLYFFVLFSNYSGVAVVDLGIAALFLLIHTAWGLTTDLYVKKGNAFVLICSLLFVACSFHEKRIICHQNSIILLFYVSFIFAFTIFISFRNINLCCTVIN